MLQATLQSYFAINQAQDTIAAKQHGNVIKTLFLSYGSFATYVHPTQRYGIIFGASPKGMQMDIDQIMYQAVSKDNSTEELKGFILSQGPRESANEHLVPEQLFDDPKTAEKEVEGVSAVKAIQIAQQQGQTVYTITRENYAQVLPKLQLSMMADIRDAVNAERTVTTHEKSIQYKGWHGSGYIIIDPHSGAGAYLIDGGANGSLRFSRVFLKMIMGKMSKKRWFFRHFHLHKKTGANRPYFCQSTCLQNSIQQTPYFSFIKYNTKPIKYSIIAI